MENTVYIGIDIARKKFDAAIVVGKKKARHAVFENDLDGFTELLKWIKVVPAQCHFTLEATNTYWEELAYYLHDNDCVVSVVNPKCISAYATSQNLRSKTDKIDAALIARYGEKEQPAQWHPPQAHLRELLLLQRQIDHLKTRKSGEKTRKSMSRNTLVVSSIERSITALEDEIATMEREVSVLIESNEDMKKSAELLATIPAIGGKTIPWLLAYLWDGKRFKNGKAAATYAGLTPMQHESGTSVMTRPRISKIGHKDIRKALYMPAMVFSVGRYKDGAYRDFVQHLENRGKPKKVIIVALMRKLITIAQGVLSTQQPFDANKHQSRFSNA